MCVCVSCSMSFLNLALLYRPCMNMYVHLFYVSCFTMKDILACVELMPCLMTEDASPCIFNLGSPLMLVVSFMVAL